MKRPRIPEPPGRPLLLEKLKLLVRDVHSKAHRIAIQSSKEKELLEYVLLEAEASEPYQHQSLKHPATPRMSDLASPRLDADFAGRSGGVPIRPGTSSGKRPTTSGSQRPVSRGSTISVSSTSSLLESPEVGPHVCTHAVLVFGLYGVSGDNIFVSALLCSCRST